MLSVKKCKVDSPKLMKNSYSGYSSVGRSKSKFKRSTIALNTEEAEKYTQEHYLVI